jgi:AraC-like DNA-binding protein
MRTIFAFNGSIADMRRVYGSVVQSEFYEGEISGIDENNFDFTLEKALDHPIGLMRTTSRSGISFRRTLADIRRNKVGVRVIWFVRSGSLKIVRSQHSCTVTAGQCAILDSGTPFLAKALAEDGAMFEAVEAVVPARLFLTHLPAAIEFGSSFDLPEGEQQVVLKLLQLLFEDGETLSRNASEHLVGAFLETISDFIGTLADRPAPRVRLFDKRLADIESYIMRNLTDPELCYDTVALRCGISPRYLCHVLKANNTSFSELVWMQRLPKAREWLASKQLSTFPIHEIAFMAGFKSAAHFSRMFKATYGVTPKEYRTQMLEEVAPSVPEIANQTPVETTH